MQLHRAPSACSLAFVTVLTGCAATGPGIQQERDVLTWSAQRAADESKLIQSYLAHEFAPASDKATMQTRAVVLAQHAKEQAELVAAFKADGSAASKRSFRDLQDRDAGLREELRSVERDWAVWQVQHGLRKSQDAELVYERNAADC